MIDLLLFLQQDVSIDEEFNWPLGVFLATSAFALFGAAAIAVWQIAGAMKARFAGQQADAYRKLAEESVEAQEATSAALTEVSKQLNDVRHRLTELERILNSVE